MEVTEIKIVQNFCLYATAIVVIIVAIYFDSMLIRSVELFHSIQITLKKMIEKCYPIWISVCF